MRPVAAGAREPAVHRATILLIRPVSSRTAARFVIRSSSSLSIKGSPSRWPHASWKVLTSLAPDPAPAPLTRCMCTRTVESVSPAWVSSGGSRIVDVLRGRPAMTIDAVGEVPCWPCCCKSPGLGRSWVLIRSSQHAVEAVMEVVPRSLTRVRLLTGLMRLERRSGTMVWSTPLGVGHEATTITPFPEPLPQVPGTWRNDCRRRSCCCGL